ncbi:MAG: sulfite exporter TauE/SafE family protein, partial [Desulfatitalea sp.]
MYRKFSLCFSILLLAAILATPLMTAMEANAASLEEAIAQAPKGTDKGQIDPSAPTGYLGIPGGKQVNLVLAFFWALWVGWVFSTVGAFGGIMAGVGHISIFGLGAYAKTFKDTAPTLNKFITDSIRVSN